MEAGWKSLGGQSSPPQNCSRFADGPSPPPAPHPLPARRSPRPPLPAAPQPALPTTPGSPRSEDPQAALSGRVRATHLGARSSSCGQPGSSQLERPPSLAAPGVPGRPCPKGDGLTFKKRQGPCSEGPGRRAASPAPLTLNRPRPLPLASRPRWCVPAGTRDAVAPTGHLGSLAAP